LVCGRNGDRDVPGNRLLNDVRQVCVCRSPPRTGLVAGSDEFNPEVW
jgi:hypothetical protein